MDEKAKTTQQPQKTQTTNWLDEIRGQHNAAGVIHAGLLRENHINRALAKEGGTPESDERFETTRFKTFFNLKNVDPERAFSNKNKIERLRLLKEYLFSEVMENVSRHGLNAKKVVAQWNKKKAWLMEFDNILDQISAK